MTLQDTAIEQQLKLFIEQALREDIRSGDHTTLACIHESQISTAQLLIKDVGVVAGVEIAHYILNMLDPHTQIKNFMVDGQAVSFGDVVFEVTCNTHALMKGERLLLNIMQRMSGIATLSNRFKFEVEDLPVTILDTRKTTPCLRFLEKWAVRLGGCVNYRFGLDDWIMIKDNHIEAAGGITAAIERVQQYLKDNNLDLGITIEVRNLVELHEVLQTGGVTRIMLDNFELPLLQEAVDTIQQKFESEASGGVNINNVRAIAQTGVDFISVGALTHSFSSLDMSLKVVNNRKA